MHAEIAPALQALLRAPQEHIAPECPPCDHFSRRDLARPGNGEPLAPQQRVAEERRSLSRGWECRFRLHVGAMPLEKIKMAGVNSEVRSVYTDNRASGVANRGSPAAREPMRAAGPWENERSGSGKRSVNHVDGFLRDGVEGGHGLRVRLKGALRDDEVRELGGDVHVRFLERSILQRAQPVGSRE